MPASSWHSLRRLAAAVQVAAGDHVVEHVGISGLGFGPARDPHVVAVAAAHHAVEVKAAANHPEAVAAPRSMAIKGGADKLVATAWGSSRRLDEAFLGEPFEDPVQGRRAGLKIDQIGVQAQTIGGSRTEHLSQGQQAPGQRRTDRSQAMRHQSTMAETHSNQSGCTVEYGRDSQSRGVRPGSFRGSVLRSIAADRMPAP